MASMIPGVAPALASPAVASGEDIEMKSPNANGDDAEDPNKLPDNAIETLYVHNLNESVRMEGETSWLLTLDVRLQTRLVSQS
jgi:hypothetical protein